MKILAIRIKNLASLEGPFEIDFLKEPLFSSGLFAITGPTGAGKSTILDAVCLALYAKTSRHSKAERTGSAILDSVNNKIAANDVRSILRRGAADGYSEIDFIGIDGIKYRAKWSVRRARNKADGKIQDDTTELINLNTNIPYPGKATETKNEIERLAGLNFDQFTRSVLLAQGDFTAFLKADKTEKSSLLEKLTGTDIYSEISKLIFQKNKSAEQELVGLKNQMEGIALLSPEEYMRLNEQREKFIEEAVQLQNEAKALATEADWHKTLKELNASILDAEKEWLQAAQKKEKESGRVEMLSNVERVQGARSVMESKTEAGQILKKKQEEMEALINKITQLDQMVQNSGVECDAATIEWQRKQKEYEDAEPSISKAKELDVKIKNNEEPLNAAEQEVKTTLSKKQKHLDTITGKEKEINEKTLTADELNQWKAKNATKQPLAENFELIVSKLKDAGKLLAQQQTINKDIETNKESRGKNDNEIALLEKTLLEKAEVLQQITDTLKEKENELNAYDIPELKANEGSLSKSLENTLGAQGCWALLYAKQQEHEKYVSKISGCKTEMAQAAAKLLLRKEELNAAVIRKEQTAKLLSKAKLETAKDVKKMRTELTAGDPCPVCGSQHHPYKENDYAADHIIDELNKEHDKCEQAYTTLLKLCSSLEMQCKTSEKNLKDFEKEALDILAEVDKQTEIWESSALDARCVALPASERLAWFGPEIKTLRQALGETQNKIKKYDEINDVIQKQNKKWQELKDEYSQFDELKRNRQKIKRDIELELARLTKDLTECEENSKGIVDEINPYFTIPEWHDNWKKDRSVFEHKLKTFADEWKETVSALEANVTLLGGLKIELEGLKKQLGSFEENEQKEMNNHSGLIKKQESLLNERKELFGEKDIAKVEQTFKKSIDDASGAVEKYKEKKNEAEKAVGNANGELVQLKKNILETCAKLEDSNQQIKHWLQEYNKSSPSETTEESLAVLLKQDTAWIETERNWLRKMEDEITEAAATKKDRSQELSEHLEKKKTEHTEEEIETKREDITQRMEELNKEKTELEFKLRQNNDNKKQVGKIDDEIKSKQGYYDNWQKLDGLLGSATGEKFRQIAQEYTLDILLGYANIHLGDLADRYKLERIADSLALQVIDRYMGDDVRSVHSLSGGESFLVSLALALGLASLKSNKMKVESLFIDEGFGSLDTDTLNVAMDALERLRHQGRKVGVISHVREMTERINTQIKVTKLPNAKSRIDITA